MWTKLLNVALTMHILIRSYVQITAVYDGILNFKSVEGSG